MGGKALHGVTHLFKSLSPQQECGHQCREGHASGMCGMGLPRAGAREQFLGPRQPRHPPHRISAQLPVYGPSSICGDHGALEGFSGQQDTAWGNSAAWPRLDLTRPDELPRSSSALPQITLRTQQKTPLGVFEKAFTYLKVSFF